MASESRVDWLKLGDANTRFFHAYVKMRQSSNTIHTLVNDDGTICLGQVSLQEEVRSFYSRLMGTAVEELLMVDKVVVERGPTLNRQQQIMLGAACSTQEVKEALFSIDSNKTPGIDGFNGYFFKKS